jgi:hypothetical protein
LLTLLLALHTVATRASVALAGAELSATDNLDERVKGTVRSALAAGIEGSKAANAPEPHKSRLSSEVGIEDVNVIRKVGIRHRPGRRINPGKGSVSRGIGHGNEVVVEVLMW